MPKKPSPAATLSQESMEHEAMTLETRSPDLLKRIKELGAEQAALQSAAEAKAAEMTELNKKIEAIRGGPGCEGQLPQAMSEAGMVEFRLETGATIKVSDNLQIPSMAKDSIRREPMVKWLEENGHGGVVKNGLVILFDKGDERVDGVEEYLKEKGIGYDLSATVHAQTLKKLLNEVLEDGDELPMEELGISIFKQSVVK